MTEDTKKIIYSMVEVGKAYDGKPVLRDISLSYFYGAKIGVLGLNGSGKSTLLRIMAGVDQDHLGETVKAPGFTVGYLEQEPKLDLTKTVRELVEEGAAETVAALREFDSINERLGEPLDDDEMTRLIERQGEVQEQLDRLNAWDLDSRLELAMEALRCPAGDTPAAVISGGERRRVALCRLLLRAPDILLLDEPTNHLDAESVAWLEHHLREYAGTVIGVTHDRYFLDNVAGWILELDRGYGIPWKGNYSSWLEQKQQRLEREEKAETARRRTLERELEWVRMTHKARHAKTKARLNAYNSLLEQESESRREELEIYIPPGPRLGGVVAKFDGVRKGYDGKLLCDGLSVDIPAGAIVGVIGANGAGKTTLFRLLTGEEQPDAGKVTVGETVVIAYADQSRALAGEKRVWEEVSGGGDTVNLGGREVASRAYAARFNFSGAGQQKFVRVLSGGERIRVHLARVLRSGANLLLLDEPTNDLDVNTLRALEAGLDNFGGSAIVISHDRWFLDRVTTHTLAFEGDSEVFWYPGPYSEYAEDRKKRLGDRADRPSRITYRKLTRA